MGKQKNIVEISNNVEKVKKPKPSGFKFHEKVSKDGMLLFGFDAEIKYDEEFDLYPIIVIHRFYHDMRNFNYKEIDELDKRNIIKQIINLFENGSLVYLDYRFKLIKFSTDGYKYDINVMSYSLANIMGDLIREMIKNNIQGYIYGRCKEGERVFSLVEYLDETKRFGCETYNRIATSVEHLRKTEEFFEIGSKEYNLKYKKTTKHNKN